MPKVVPVIVIFTLCCLIFEHEHSDNCIYNEDHTIETKKLKKAVKGKFDGFDDFPDASEPLAFEKLKKPRDS
jgi:hypothetical protein